MAARRGPPRGRRGAKKKSGGSGRGPGRGDGKFLQRGNARYDRHDTYYKQAKREGFVARSVYKLEEIDEQYGLVTPGDRVLDLGCAPGSWMQYVSDRVRPDKGGAAVGVDLLEVAVSFPPHVRIMQGDVFELGPEEMLGDAEARFDLVLSDMAPNTTGIRSADQARSMALCERALELSFRVLAEGGRFCVKVLEGGEVPAFLTTCRKVFDEVKVKRPKGTRAGSMETYIIGLGFKPRALHMAELAARHDDGDH